MAQVTIYLDEETERKMKEAATAAGLSYSKWISGLIREKTRTEWPENVARLAGAWADPSSDDEPRIAARDIPREPF